MYEISDVFTAIGESNNGKQVECYYVIQRLPMDNSYIASHLSELEDDYYASIIAPMLDAETENLEFEANSKYKEYDLLNLEAPTDGTLTVVIIVCVIVSVLVIAATVTFIIIKRKNKKKNVSYVSKEKKRNK